MFKTTKWSEAFEIDHIATCNFENLTPMSNKEILEFGREGVVDTRLEAFFEKKMGIKNRYFVSKERNAYDLALESLENLLKKDPSLIEEAEFLIFGGISNALPTVCHASLMACETGLKNVSCWDLKSGCSTGVLALVQALEWFEKGAKKGIIVCSETFSKFTQPETLQMTASIGDGAVALSVSQSSNWKTLGVVHGTDATYFKSMFVPGVYPIDSETYKAEDYFFKFENAPETLVKTAHYWNQSLVDLFELTNVPAASITHYIAHQVDGSKNKMFAKSCGIADEAIMTNFVNFGNMGCPTIFINYYQNLDKMTFKKGDRMIYHAVGGGLSWASIMLERIS
jgi:3-oxoacyl-[acyl-carrier-protein] synthase-3